MCALIYAVIALVALAVAAAWLCWRCLSLRKALARSQARCHELQKERAIRQNLQQVLDRREADIRRLRAKMATYENDYHEMESHASDLSVSLFRESGLRILAEKEDGAKRLKMEQLEQQLADMRDKLRRKEAQRQEEAGQAARREQQLREDMAAQQARLQEEIDKQESEINRLRTINARRLARRTQSDNGTLDQVTLDDILGK